MNPPRLFLQTCFVALLTFVSASVGADWTDPVGDTGLPNGDVISGSATVSGGMVDLRVRFAAVPFPDFSTVNLHWFLDLDQNPATGIDYGGANVVGIEKFIHVTRLFSSAPHGCQVQVFSDIEHVAAVLSVIAPGGRRHLQLLVDWELPLRFRPGRAGSGLRPIHERD